MDSWPDNNVDYPKLKKIQTQLAKQIEVRSLTNKPSIIAGYDSQSCGMHHIGALCYFDLDTQNHLETQYVKISSKEIPRYEPGFLALQEMPIFNKLWHKRVLEPDIVVIDGNGLLHPRRCGFATHLSFIIDRPTFGIAKSLLLGDYNKLQPEKGSYADIVENNDVIGQAVRTRDNTNPVFISVGSKIDLTTCRTITLRFSKYRRPELIRQPDILSRAHCREVK